MTKVIEDDDAVFKCRCGSVYDGRIPVVGECPLYGNVINIEGFLGKRNEYENACGVM